MDFVQISIILFLFTLSDAAPLDINENIINQNDLDIQTSEPDLEIKDDADPEEIGGYFEGDMEIDLAKNGFANAARHWPFGKVFYKFDAAFGNTINLLIYFF